MPHLQRNLSYSSLCDSGNGNISQLQDIFLATMAYNDFLDHSRVKDFLFDQRAKILWINPFCWMRRCRVLASPSRPS